MRLELEMDGEMSWADKGVVATHLESHLSASLETPFKFEKITSKPSAESSVRVSVLTTDLSDFQVCAVARAMSSLQDVIQADGLETAFKGPNVLTFERKVASG